MTFSGAGARLIDDLRRIPLELDPPEHTVFRRILQPYFTAIEFTLLFPTRVLCATVNIPDEDWQKLKRWAGEVRNPGPTDTGGSPPRQAGNDAFLAYAREMIASRRESPLDPAEDITSGLFAARHRRSTADRRAADRRYFATASLGWTQLDHHLAWDPH